MIRNFIAKIWPKKAENVVLSPVASAIKVLLIDANDMDRSSAKRILGKGFTVADFSNSFTAIEFAKENPFDIVIINDSYSEKLNAAQVLSSLRQNCRQSFRAFAATTHYSTPQRAFLLNAGFEELLCKPIDGAAVTDLICFKRIQGT